MRFGIDPQTLTATENVPLPYGRRMTERRGQTAIPSLSPVWHIFERRQGQALRVATTRRARDSVTEGTFSFYRQFRYTRYLTHPHIR